MKTLQSKKKQMNFKDIKKLSYQICSIKKQNNKDHFFNLIIIKGNQFNKDN